MEQIKEAVYLINDERYLHLRENGAGVGFATYNKVTGEPLESGQISEKNLPPDGRNAISAARNWYLFELSDDDRMAIQQESVKILENIPQAGIGRRRIWEPETLPKDIRLINSHYDDLYRIPDDAEALGDLRADPVAAALFPLRLNAFLQSDHEVARARGVAVGGDVVEFLLHHVGP